MGQQGTESSCRSYRQMERTSQGSHQTHTRLGDWAQDVSQDLVHIPRLDACPVNQDDHLPYSLIMCLDLVKVVS